MSDNQFLYFVLVLIYLFECIIWVNSTGIAFKKGFKSWKVVFPNTLLGNERGGLAFAYPLPSLGRFYISHITPVSFSPEGIVNFSLETLAKKIPKVVVSLKFFAYKDIHSAENKGSDIWINDEIFCKCGSHVQATLTVNAVNFLLKNGNKEKHICKYFDSLFNIDSIKRLIGEFDVTTKFLNIICNTQYVILFLISPILVYFFGSVLIIWSAAYLFASNIILIYMFYAAHKHLLPDLKKERLTDAVKMFLCPPLSIRAVDIISLPFISNYHSIAVAYSTLDSSRFESFAKQALLSYNFPNHILQDIEYKQVFEWHMSSMNTSAKAFIEKIGLDVNKLLEAPERTDDINSFCPRCHSQFTFKDGQCSECSGVQLIGYAGGKNE